MVTDQPASVITPGGPRPRVRVHVVEPGNPVTVISKGRLSYRPHGGKDLLMVEALNVPLQAQNPAASGWIAWAAWRNTSGSPIVSFSSAWTVPPAPVTNSRQLVYLFNGLVSDDSSTILQPVLQWGESPSGGGVGWYVGSWFVQKDGQAFSSPMVPVVEGQVLTGVMTLRNQFGASFSYTSEFLGIPNSSLLVDGVSELTWAYETLEAYGLTRREDYPATASTSISQIRLSTRVGVPPGLNWLGQANPNVNFGEHVTINPADVTLYY